VILSFVLSLALAGTVASWVATYMRGQRVRMQLAALISILYLDQKNRDSFASGYESFLTTLDPGLDRSTRAAHCARTIEGYAKHMNTNTYNMLFLGYSRGQFEEVGRRARAADPQVPNETSPV